MEVVYRYPAPSVESSPDWPDWYSDDATPDDPIALVIARLSLRGDTEETGIDRQVRDGLEDAQRDGFRHVIFCVDDGFSASNPKVYRPRFHAALTLMRDDPRVIGMYAWRGERVARRHLDGEWLVGAIEKAERRKAIVGGHTTKGYLKTRMDGIDTRRPGGTDWLRNTVTFGKMEAQAIKQRVSRSHESKWENARYSGSPPAFGHRDGTGWREIEEEEAEEIRRAARRIVEDGAGVMSVLRDWWKRGIKTRAGNDWQYKAWVQMMTSGRMAGMRLRRVEGGPDVELMPDPADPRRIAPILDLQLWRNLRVVLLDSPRKAGPKHDGTLRHLLTNILRCDVCRGTLRAKGQGGKQNGPNYWTYGCTRDPAHPHACGRVWIKGQPTDDLVEQMVLTILRSPSFRASQAGRAGGGGQSPNQEIAGSLHSRADQIVDQLRSLEMAVLEGNLEEKFHVRLDTYMEYRKNKYTELDEINARLARLERRSAIELALPDPDAYWGRADLETKRDLIRLLLPEIRVVQAKSIKAFPQRWTPDRIVFERVAGLDDEDPEKASDAG